MKKILLAIPTRGQIHPLTMDTVIGLLADTRHQVEMFQGWTGRGPEEARSHIAKYFLANDYDFMLTIDDDVSLDKNPLDMVELNKDVIGCPYPVLMTNGIQLCAYRDEKAIRGKGLEQVDELGLGCTLIARRVIESLKDEVPFVAIRNLDGTWRVSEDRAFCRKAKQKGFEIWANFDILPHHFVDIDLTKYWINVK